MRIRHDELARSCRGTQSAEPYKAAESPFLWTVCPRLCGSSKNEFHTPFITKLGRFLRARPALHQRSQGWSKRPGAFHAPMNNFKHNPRSIFRREIPAPPVQGIHQWLPRAAWAMRANGMTADQAVAALRAHEPELRRPYQPLEVEGAVSFVYNQQALAAGGRGMRTTSSRSRRPRISDIPFSPEKLAQIAAKLPGVDEAWFKARSPTPVESMGPGGFLHNLTGRGEKILCFKEYKSQGQLLWRNDGILMDPLSTWRYGREDGAWFLPQPVTGEWAEVDRLKKSYNPRGLTRRAEENITHFRFALLESDVAPQDQWLSALAQLPLPIVSVVTSGGKSVHALFAVNADSKEHWDDLIRGELLAPLKTIGADAAALTAIRLTRLPSVHRGERLQELLFLNPQPTGAPIATLSPLF